MLSFDEALTRLLSDAPRLSSERVALSQAFGRVLAEDIAATLPLPPFDASAMDGYALALSDLQGSGHWDLRLSGASHAGQAPPALTASTCMRILTGAPIPAGADAVVMQEKVELLGDKVRFTARPGLGDNIRRAGEDLAAGAPGLTAGTRLGAAQLALAAALDRGELTVARRPYVAVLPTGSELRPPGSAPRPASIPESNAVALAALVTAAGASVRILPSVPDDPAATARAITDALVATDVLLTVGGVSVGDQDFVRPALEQAGVKLEFWRVAMKPGKPLAFGRGPAIRVLGLPGNPASAVVTCALFAVPLLRSMQGDASVRPPLLTARLEAPVRHTAGRLEFLRARLGVKAGVLSVRALDNQSSGSVPTLAAADCLALLPADVENLAAGDPVGILRLTDL